MGRAAALGSPAAAPRSPPAAPRTRRGRRPASPVRSPAPSPARPGGAGVGELPWRRPRKYPPLRRREASPFCGNCQPLRARRRPPGTNSSSASAPPYSATSIAFEPMTTPSAPASSAARAAAGREMPNPTSSGSRVCREPADQRRHPLGQAVAGAGDAGHRDQVDEAARARAGQRDPLVGAGRRQQRHQVEAVGAAALQQLAGLVVRQVGHDQPVGAGRGGVGAEALFAVGQHRAGVGHRHQRHRHPPAQLADRLQRPCRSSCRRAAPAGRPAGRWARRPADPRRGCRSRSRWRRRARPPRPTRPVSWSAIR